MYSLKAVPSGPIKPQVQPRLLIFKIGKSYRNNSTTLQIAIFILCKFTIFFLMFFFNYKWVWYDTSELSKTTYVCQINTVI